jgi:hypothetical protein
MVTQGLCWAGEVPYEDFATKLRHPEGIVLFSHLSLEDHNIKEWMENASIGAE